MVVHRRKSLFGLAYGSGALRVHHGGEHGSSYSMVLRTESRELLSLSTITKQNEQTGSRVRP